MLELAAISQVLGNVPAVSWHMVRHLRCSRIQHLGGIVHQLGTLLDRLSVMEIRRVGPKFDFVGSIEGVPVDGGHITKGLDILVHYPRARH